MNLGPNADPRICATYVTVLIAIAGVMIAPFLHSIGISRLLYQPLLPTLFPQVVDMEQKREMINKGRWAISAFITHVFLWIFISPLLVMVLHWIFSLFASILGIMALAG